MSSLVVNENYDENIREGETHFDPFSNFSDGLIEQMAMNEVEGKFEKEINYLASTEDAKLLRLAIFEIAVGLDKDDKVLAALERTDSKLIYHQNKDDYTPRESVCAYLDTVCEWSILFPNSGNIENDTTIYSVSDLYAEYQDFLKRELPNFPYSKRFKLRDFSDYLKGHCRMLKRNMAVNGKKIRGDSLDGLPQYKIW